MIVKKKLLVVFLRDGLKSNTIKASKLLTPLRITVDRCIFKKVIVNTHVRASSSA